MSFFGGLSREFSVNRGAGRLIGKEDREIVGGYVRVHGEGEGIVYFPILGCLHL